MDPQRLRVAFLVGSDNSSTRLSIEAVCRLPGVVPVAVLLDDAPVPFSRRLKNLRRNIRSDGWTYPFLRLMDALQGVTTTLVHRVGPSRAEVEEVLRNAFPDAVFSLAELAEKYGAALHRVPNLNSPAATEVLRTCAADLGIVIGTRVLKPATFSVPARGCVNLHKGKVPEYRGMPPGFWELYDGADTCGVTVHFVDKGLDTGDIVATATIPILATETPDTLLQKLHVEGARSLAAAIADIRDNRVTPQPQEKDTRRARTRPNRAAVTALRRRLPHWKQPSSGAVAGRNLYLLFIYFSGIYWLVRSVHRLQASRGAIFLYHRVNDYAWDALTVDRATFAGQLLAVSRRYPVSRTDRLVDRISLRQPLAPTTVAIHFDDCYRDVLTNGAPILKSLNLPACAFVNSGFVGSARTFAHDAAKYPFAFEMLRPEDVKAWVAEGFEIGAHTVNHVDLGRIDAATATTEVEECGTALRLLTGGAVELFSFPFGRTDNITPATKQVVVNAGYRALFSAHGGFVGSETHVFDIPRAGVSWEASPLYCLLQIEGLTPAQLASALRGK